MKQPPPGIKSYLGEIQDHRVLTREEEFQLFERYHQGDAEAREEIVSCNLRLVVCLAQRFKTKGLPLEDLIQEGNIGLLEVIKRFDHTLGYRFSTYATFWIRQAMQVAVRKQGPMIRLPVRKARLLGRINELMHEFLSILGRHPTVRELAQRLELEASQVTELVQLARTTLSLDSPINDEGFTLIERVADPMAPSPQQQSIQHEIVQRVSEVLSHLTPRENNVLEMRFGLGGYQADSLRAVSRRVGLSQEGVRRVEKRALAKLGRKQLRQQLAGFI